MAQNNVTDLYTPNHDEASRQEFTGVLKGLVNGKLEALLGQSFEQKLAPDFATSHGYAPQSREDAAKAFADAPLYQLWGSLVYTSQDLMWETVGETVDRQRTLFEARAKALEDKGESVGSLTLNPDLVLPEPIASREIHRQPGGYFYQADDKDLTSPLLYFSSVELYRTAKGLSSGADTGEPGMGRFMVKAFKDRFPEMQPKRVLDLGCAIGTETIAFYEAFPEADIHGADLSGPFVRFAHLWAEDQGIPIHYKQADARDTGYEDGSFDLIVSHIMFHETGHDILPDIMKEVKRLLAPGGVFINGDVPYQPHKIPLHRQALNGWQVTYNGEPFWNGFADTDVPAALRDAGFAADKVFAGYVPLGRGDYYLFGAQQDETLER